MLRRTSTYAVPTNRSAQRRLTRHSTPMIPATVLRTMVRRLSHRVTTMAPGKSPKYDEIARRLNWYMVDRARRQTVVTGRRATHRGAREARDERRGSRLPPIRENQNSCWIFGSSKPKCFLNSWAFSPEALNCFTHVFRTRHQSKSPAGRPMQISS